MPRFSEKSLVEDYFIEKLQEKGWQYLSADNLERENLEEPLLTPTLTRALKHLNAGIGIRNEEVIRALNELRLKSSSSEGAKQTLNYIKYGVPIKFEKERIVKYVKLFDYDKIENNECVVSRQVVHRSGDKSIQNDIVLYINGIPLVNIECKNPASFTESWFSAYKQTKQYERDVPELYKYIQIGVGAEQTAKYFPIVPWQEETKTHTWHEEGKDPIDSTIDMLAPATLLSILRDYLFFRIEHGSTTKVIARYMQYRAAERMYNRVTSYLEGKEDKNKGLIWHWQGSGKTLTMIFAANKLYRDKQLENPTIFFIVDREELEDQLYQEFTALDITKPETIDSIDALRTTLRHDENRGKRGIFITLIHKFRPEEFQQLQGELEKLSVTRETIQTRRNVILFIDEAHRTQYGMLAAQMKLLLKDASSFALTGTPIAKAGRDTYTEFSYPPDEKFLDKYFITDSIQDAFTLKIAYQPRLEKEAHLDKQMLDAFIEVELDEIPEEYRERTEERIKRKLNAIKVFLENSDRITLVAQDIASQFKENVDGKFKALVVAVDRLACVRYKKALDRLLPEEYSEVIMTFNRNDPQEIKDYEKELADRHHGRQMEDIRKETIVRYKEESYPKILIVTEMLLTGFDVPILQTMYLDKPLKEHRLLQAIARTNRPYGDLKEAGMIVDYVGILKEFRRAFENYSREDIQGVLLDLEQLRKEFTQIIDETLGLFQGVPKDRFDRHTMLMAMEVLTTNEHNSNMFQENYKHLRKLFEILGPDEVKIQKLSEYVWLTQVYLYHARMLRTGDSDDDIYVEKYFNKTLKYVYKATQLGAIEKEYPTIDFDEHYLRNLQEKVKSKEEKAANILFTLNRFILTDKQRSPVYETLSERVERILKLWKEKTRDYDRIYNEAASIFNEITRLRGRQKQLGFTDLQYSILLALEQKFGRQKDLTSDVRELTDQMRSRMFEGWYYQPAIRKNVERDVRKYLRKYVRSQELVLADLDEMYQRIMENVKTYG